MLQCSHKTPFKLNGRHHREVSCMHRTADIGHPDSTNTVGRSMSNSMSTPKTEPRVPHYRTSGAHSPSAGHALTVLLLVVRKEGITVLAPHALVHAVGWRRPGGDAVRSAWERPERVQIRPLHGNRCCDRSESVLESVEEGLGRGGLALRVEELVDRGF